MNSVRNTGGETNFGVKMMSLTTLVHTDFEMSAGVSLKLYSRRLKGNVNI